MPLRVFPIDDIVTELDEGSVHAAVGSQQPFKLTNIHPDFYRNLGKIADQFAGDHPPVVQFESTGLAQDVTEYAGHRGGA